MLCRKSDMSAEFHAASGLSLWDNRESFSAVKCLLFFAAVAAFYHISFLRAVHGSFGFA